MSEQSFNANRAFIQWAGFTFGRAQSFYDFYSGAAYSYFGFYPQSDTGDGGKDVLAYTAQFGNGFSASLSAELPPRTQILGGGLGTIVGGGATNNTGYGGYNAPDIVGNLRVDQAWGSAQIAGALHQVNGLYYSNSASLVNPEGSGHPDDKMGFAVAGGFKLNTPMIGAGDNFATQVNYTQGALKYMFQNPGGNAYIQNSGNAAFGIISDGVYGGTVAGGTATDVQLTTAWGVNAAYEHFWNPRWRTSVHGGYTRSPTAHRPITCSVSAQTFGTGAGSAALATAGCDNDWNMWWVGSRTQWNVTKDFYMGLDIAYAKIEGMNTPTGFLQTSAIPSGTSQTKTAGRRGQLAVPVPRPSRLLSLIG